VVKTTTTKNLEKMNNPLIQDNLTSLIIAVGLIILIGALIIGNSKVDVWHPSDIYPNCDDQRNIIDVRIKNITNENAEEVIGYFDVSMQRYHDYSMNVIDYEFMWCYE